MITEAYPDLCVEAASSSIAATMNLADLDSLDYRGSHWT
jgi:hypothetical protein